MDMEMHDSRVRDPNSGHDHDRGVDHAADPRLSRLGHSHDRVGGVTESIRRRLTFTLLLSGSYMIAEVVGGLLANSLALLADAGHMLSDVAALGLSLFAVWIAGQPASPGRSYGYWRAEILAALVNGVTLVAIALVIVREAFERFRNPPEVQGGLMMAIAIGGLLVNLTSLFILRGGKGESLNVRGAWLHVLTDALGSIGAITAGVLIWWTGWNWIDPATSLFIAGLVLFSAWPLLKESVSILMEWAPGNIDVEAVRRMMNGVPGVIVVHDLHIWTITSGMVALSAHVLVRENSPELLETLRRGLHDRFGIDHVTLQLEEELDEAKRPRW